MLITLNVKPSNIAASQVYTSEWSNYAALINHMPIDTIDWVTIQMYNFVGCVYGIDEVSDVLA